jgi:2-polyprenyl-6-methoxyphenol hydroxylase-like FAD-dependent oxidoreductase
MIANQVKKILGENLSGAKTLGHAVVIGGGIAGLSAAQILARYFKRVTIVERDCSRSESGFRQGAPQARHAHTLLPAGQTILERLFPGLCDELLAKGALGIKSELDTAFYKEGAWQKPNPNPNGVSIISSRPLLEALIYQRLADRPAIRFMEGFEVVGLEVDEEGRRVTGVRLRQRHAPGSMEISLAADLVVDASGRSSGASRWLESLGYESPRQEMVDAFTGYASRIYRRPAEFAAGWKSLYIRPSVSESRRGGIMLPLEDDRWHVTLIGMAHDYPPTGEDEFLKFARSLPTQTLYQAIRDAEPLTNISGYRNTANRVRYYDRLPRYLEGFLVTGDAVYTLNPVYALGMTASVMGSMALERSLKEQLRQNAGEDLIGLARRFQKRLSQAVDRLWEMATEEDLLWPGTEVKENLLPKRHNVPARDLNAVPLMA